MRVGFFIILFFVLKVCHAQVLFAKQWDSRFGGTSAEGLWTMIAVNNGGCLLVGASDSGMDGNKSQPSQGSSDFWIVMLDPLGNKVYDKRYGSNQADGIFAVKQTKDQGFLLGGWSSGTASADKSEPSRGGWDFWVVKIDSLGNKKWDKTLGGSLEDYVTAMDETDDGGYILGGESCSPVSGDKSEGCWDPSNLLRDYWIVRTDSIGNKLWDKRFGGKNDEFLSSVIQTSDKGFLLAGSSGSDSSGNKTVTNWGGHDDTDYWLIKLDSLGNEEWQHHYGTQYDEALRCDVLELADGYMLGGVSGADISGDKSENKSGYWLVKINKQGIKLWDRSWGGMEAEDFRGLRQTYDGGFLFSGITPIHFAIGDKTENNLGNNQTWLVKTDSVGNKEWDKTIFSVDENSGIASQIKDGCYVVGCATSDGVGGYITQPNWGAPFGDYWVMKFCMEPVSIRGTEMPEPFFVFPNPFSSYVSIEIPNATNREFHIVICNSMGQVVYEGRESNLSNNYTKNVDLSYLQTGAYFLQIRSDEETMTKVLVKE